MRQIEQDTKNLFDQPITNKIKTYETIKNIFTGQGDDYTSCCLIDYSCFKKNYKIIPRELRVQLIPKIKFFWESTSLPF